LAKKISFQKTYISSWLNFLSGQNLDLILAKFLSLSKTYIPYWLKFSLLAQTMSIIGQTYNSWQNLFYFG
jgi:hypothetical protein